MNGNFLKKEYETQFSKVIKHIIFNYLVNNISKFSGYKNQLEACETADQWFEKINSIHQSLSDKDVIGKINYEILDRRLNQEIETLGEMLNKKGESKYLEWYAEVYAILSKNAISEIVNREVKTFAPTLIKFLRNWSDEFESK